MSSDFVLPPGVDFTVDDLPILPGEYRYDLIGGELILEQRAPLSQLAGLRKNARPSR
jgi:hypothetical protein